MVSTFINSAVEHSQVRAWELGEPWNGPRGTSGQGAGTAGAHSRLAPSALPGAFVSDFFSSSLYQCYQREVACCVCFHTLNVFIWSN